MKKLKYQVWIEGYAATGESGTAQFLGVYEGKTFKDACKTAMRDKNWEIHKHYNEENNSYWACHFYDNEKDARKSFG